MSFRTFSTHAPNFLSEPFSQYRMLQSAPDVFWSEKERAWIVHRYRDVAALLADRNFAVVELATVVGDLSAMMGRSVADLASVLSAIFFLRNPPGHTERRHFLAALINDHPKSAHMALIDQIGRDLIAGFDGAQDIDIVKHFADVLPPLFIGRLLGLPDATVLALTAVVTEVTKSFDNGRSLRFYQRVNETVIKAWAMIDPEIADRRVVPRDDGLSRMITLWDERFGVDDMAIGSHVIFLLIAGAETTSALIGNAFAAAMDRPDGLALICDDPNLIAPWIEETLRFDGPAHQSSRIALHDCQIAGAQIAKGDRLVLLIAAAHRDPAQFAAADKFDPLRTDQALLAFGAGLHFCPGPRSPEWKP
jgi:cytochrome P450